MEMKITIFALVCAVIIVTRNTLLEYLDAKNKYQKEKKYCNPRKNPVSFLRKLNITKKVSL